MFSLTFKQKGIKMHKKQLLAVVAALVNRYDRIICYQLVKLSVVNGIVLDVLYLTFKTLLYFLPLIIALPLVMYILTAPG